MKILALEHELPNATTDRYQQYGEAALVLECQSVEEAWEALSMLPFVQNGLIAFDLIPLKAYPGFERLFVKE